MNYSDIQARIRREDMLFSALVELTYRCNLDCYFCYNDLSLEGRTLHKDQYLRFFEDLQSMGVLNLVLTGGEPLSHPDFWELATHARGLGFALRIKTNGHALRGALAERMLRDVDPLQIDISLHGATAKTHDRQTRVPGSFDRLMQNLAECRELGLRIKLNSTLTCWNEHEVEGIFEIADRFDCPLQVDPEVTPRDDGDAEPLDIRASTEGLRRLFRLQRDRARSPGPQVEASRIVVGRQDADLMKASSVPSDERKKHCGAGSVGIAVDPFGNVYPCVQWRTSIGNLHDQSVQEIWANRAVLDPLRDTLMQVSEKIAAEEGGNGAHLAFCPGLAHSHSGDPTRIYDSARHRKNVQLEVIEEAAGTSRTQSRETWSVDPEPAESTRRSAPSGTRERALPVLG